MSSFGHLVLIYFMSLKSIPILRLARFLSLRLLFGMCILVALEQHDNNTYTFILLLNLTKYY